MKCRALVGKMIVVFLIAGCGICAMVGLMWYGAVNTEIELRNRMETEVKSRDNHLSTCFAVINQLAQVANSAADTFKEVYPEIMEKGIGKGGAFMKWVQQNSPVDFTIQENYSKLMVAVEAQRNQLRTKQDQMLDVARAYNAFIEKPWNRLFVGTKTKMTPTVIVTQSSAETIESGVESDSNLELEL